MKFNRRKFMKWLTLGMVSIPIAVKVAEQAKPSSWKSSVMQGPSPNEPITVEMIERLAAKTPQRVLTLDDFKEMIINTQICDCGEENIDLEIVNEFHSFWCPNENCAVEYLWRSTQEIHEEANQLWALYLREQNPKYFEMLENLSDEHKWSNLDKLMNNGIFPDPRSSPYPYWRGNL